MKKLILFAAILFAGVSVMKAQKPVDKTADVILKVNLTGIQSIIVKSDQKTVELDYVTPKNYLDGVEKLQEDHLQVFSTSKAFDVSVGAVAFTSTGTPIELSSIKVEAKVGSTNGLTSATYKKVDLATGGIIVKSVERGKHNNININYEGLGEDSFLDNLNEDGSNTVHQTTVTYTIVAV